MKMPDAAKILGDVSLAGMVEDFSQAVEDFSAMQQEHRDALAAGNCKDIFSWRQSREQAFRGVVRMLERVVASGRDNQGCVVRVHEIMGKLLAEEDALQELILARRLKAQEQLLAMRKGKEALQGYNINKGLVPRPRYLSSRM